MSKNKEIFSEIYAHRVWGEDGAGSGRGSTIENAERTCEIVRHVLSSFNLHSLLDAPCGALEWTIPFIRSMHQADKLFQYHGVDVVEFVVQMNRHRINEDYCAFSTMDLERQAPPSGFELILCRDTLQHLSFKSIAGVLKSLAQTDSKYLLVTSYKPTRTPWWRMKKTADNRNVGVGDFFRNDLLSAPFCFSEGLIEKFDDYRPSGHASGQLMFLYDLNILKSSNAFQEFIGCYTLASY